MKFFRQWEGCVEDVLAGRRMTHRTTANSISVIREPDLEEEGEGEKETEKGEGNIS